ncbi:unnamed protein product [Discosporangium mesarthrocarpum]
MPLSDEHFQRLHTKLMGMLTTCTNENGVHSETLSAEFGDDYPHLVDVLNSLLVDNRLVLLKGENDSMWYKLIQEEKAQKLKGLSAEQMMIYQVIERSGNRGIWTRDIKSSTNIQQQTLTKTLKTLEQRRLVKSVKSVTSKSKKLYMLYELTPAKEISGGPWYLDQEFNYEFVKDLSDAAHKFVKESKTASLSEIADRIKVCGATKVDLSQEEVQLVVNTLVYDGLLEEASFSHSRGGGPVYKVAPESEVVNSFNTFTEVPCGTCKVADQCSEDGVVSPKTCVYLTQWLNLPVDVEALDF